MLIVFMDNVACFLMLSQHFRGVGCLTWDTRFYVASWWYHVLLVYMFYISVDGNTWRHCCLSGPLSRYFLIGHGIFCLLYFHVAWL